MRTTACLVAMWLISGSVVPALAQDPEEPGPQDLDDLDEGVVIEEPFVPGIEPWTWELGLQVGYVDLDKTMLAADAIVVDVENPADAIFADMQIGGAWSFMPQVRVNYNLGSHFSFENGIGFSIGDFAQTVSEDQEKWVNPDSFNELTEEELEKGSYFIWNHEHGITWYPRGWWIFDRFSSKEGAVQPFLSLMAGTQSIFLDSDYVQEPATTFQFSYGLGLRIVGDDLYSIRVEARNYHSQVQYDVDEYFREVIGLDGESRVRFPVGRLERKDDLDPELADRIVAELGLPAPAPDKLPVPPAEFEKRNFTNLWVSVGFVAAF